MATNKKKTTITKKSAPKATKKVVVKKVTKPVSKAKKSAPKKVVVKATSIIEVKDKSFNPQAFEPK
ncbi:MAG: hypothetical protein JNJ43_18670, partial [Anaerolineales bacterium]|nr:hypothetical protein [Anaerolineales bacterium]